ncbi:MAG: phosphatidate cytidylyltransferase [Eubacteriales bacterium]|nr:phosphatidate cytidylyltransferase [Eubacteriales bacterium]
MLTRILTSAIGVVVFFLALFSPPKIFMFVIFAVIAIMLYEMYGVLKCGKFVNCVGVISAVITAFAMVLNTHINMSVAIIPVTMLYLIAVVLKHGKVNARDVLAHGFVTLFITAFMCYIIENFKMFSALGVLWVFVIAWITDSSAYFAGVFLGKHKLVPHISPKKTVEGAIGGVLAAIVAGVVYYIILVNVGTKFSWGALVSYAAMSFVGSLLSQVGDFVASCIKRDCFVKDYGSLLPGHGGLMDRFDSVVFIAPFVYYALTIINSLFIISASAL